MAFQANDQAFPFSSRHHLHPLRFLFSSRLVEIFECPDVVDLDSFPRSAEFALFGEKPVQEFVARGGVRLPDLVVEDRRLSSLERNPSPCGYQRLLSLPLDSDLETFVGALVAV